MAKPAFIYAFDNLGPERFTELCGLLLASRHKGFLLGGVGADGGVDAELDKNLGIWRPEFESPLLNEVIKPGQLVVFQFKHKVTARVGQVAARRQLLDLYKCRSAKKCELHRNLILRKRPTVYVLVTNVEVNSEFRETFIKHCRKENPNIKHYQVIGLDELEAWVTGEFELRHLYFPTIFDPPRFNLQVRLNPGATIDSIGNSVEMLFVTVLNTGAANSYVKSVTFKAIADGEFRYIDFVRPSRLMVALNPKPGAVIEPGRRMTFHYPREDLQEIKDQGKDVFLIEICVKDELDNEYLAPIEDGLRQWILPKRSSK